MQAIVVDSKSEKGAAGTYPGPINSFEDLRDICVQNVGYRKYLQVCDDFYANYQIKKAEDMYVGAAQDQNEENPVGGDMPSFVLMCDAVFR